MEFAPFVVFCVLMISGNIIAFQNGSLGCVNFVLKKIPNKIHLIKKKKKVADLQFSRWFLLLSPTVVLSSPPFIFLARTVSLKSFELAYIMSSCLGIPSHGLILLWKSCPHPPHCGGLCVHTSAAATTEAWK